MLPPAVVLAGGFGTRLSSVISDVPKPMAPVRGRPFLEFLLGHVARQGVRRVILSVGYKREVIQDHFGSAWGGLDIDYCVEDQPLGTGGGIKKAFEDHGLARAFVFNGDSYCPVALEPLLARHRERESLLTFRPSRRLQMRVASDRSRSTPRIAFALFAKKIPTVGRVSSMRGSMSSSQACLPGLPNVLAFPLKLMSCRGFTPTHPCVAL